VPSFENSRAAKERPCCISGLSADIEPVIGALSVNSQTALFLARGVLTNDLYEFSVARTARISNHETVNRQIFSADTAKTNFYHTGI
jgi:hypothetical protein